MKGRWLYNDIEVNIMKPNCGGGGARKRFSMVAAVLGSVDLVVKFVPVRWTPVQTLFNVSHPAVRSILMMPPSWHGCAEELNSGGSSDPVLRSAQLSRRGNR